MPTPPTTAFTLLSHVSNLHDYGRLLSRLFFNLHDDGLLVLPLDGRFVPRVGLLIRVHKRSCFSSRTGWDHPAERDVLLSPHAQEPCIDFLTQGADAIAAVTQDLRVWEPFMLRAVYAACC